MRRQTLLQVLQDSNLEFPFPLRFLLSPSATVPRDRDCDGRVQVQFHGSMALHSRPPAPSFQKAAAPSLGSPDQPISANFADYVTPSLGRSYSVHMNCPIPSIPCPIFLPKLF